MDEDREASWYARDRTIVNSTTITPAVVMASATNNLTAVVKRLAMTPIDALAEKPEENDGSNNPVVILERKEKVL